MIEGYIPWFPAKGNGKRGVQWLLTAFSIPGPLQWRPFPCLYPCQAPPSHALSVLSVLHFKTHCFIGGKSPLSDLHPTTLGN